MLNLFIKTTAARGAHVARREEEEEEDNGNAKAKRRKVKEIEDDRGQTERPFFLKRFACNANDDCS